MPSVADSPRLLALRSELGYTDRPDLALPDEPEAVSADYQALLTRDARARDRAIWVDARDTIRTALAMLDGQSFATIEADVRAIVRLLERIDARVVA